MTLNQVALLMEQRTGKTLPAIAIAGQRFIDEQIKKLLVIIPLSVVDVWKEQFEYADFNYMIIDLIDKKNIHREKMLKELIGNNRLQIIIINFESTWRFFKQLRKWDSNMIIVDESQKIKNRKAKQSKAVHKLRNKVEYRLILTGTPIIQSPLDIWSQYKFLNENIFPHKFSEFRDRYAVMRMRPWGYEVIRYKNLKELSRKAHSIAYRVTKDEAFDMPPIVDQILKVTLSKYALGLYKKMEKDFLIKFSETEIVTAPIILTKLLRLQQISGGFVTIGKNKKKIYKQIDSSKLRIIQELFEDLPNDRKIVIFARFIPEIEKIAKIAKKVNREAVTFTGKTKNRGQVIKSFQKSKKVTVFISQIQTGGLGIDLSVANIAIFYSTNLSFGDYDQAKSRLQGPGQKVPITYIHLIANNTEDEDILNGLKEKKKIAELIMDIWRKMHNRIYKGGENKVSVKKRKKLKKIRERMRKGDFEDKLKQLKKEVESTDVEEIPTLEKVPSVETKVLKNSGLVTEKMLAREFETNSHQVRKVLRSNFKREKQSRWEWEKDDKDLKKVREVLSENLK